MEDAIAIGNSIVAVADGHGSREDEGGKTAAEKAVVCACNGKTFDKIQNSVLTVKQVNNLAAAGCTLTVAYLTGKQKLRLKQVGDSSIMLVTPESGYGWIIPPHDSSNIEERQRMSLDGFKLTKMGFKVNDRCIQVTRAIGHDDLIHVPDEATIELTDDSACIIATDGLWNYITKEKVVDVIQNTTCPMCSAKKLMSERGIKNKMDNAAVVVISRKSCCNNCKKIKLNTPSIIYRFFNFIFNN